VRARRAVFLDRDGVLNANVFYRDTGAWEAPRRVGDFRLLPGVLTALMDLRNAGFALVLVSNQPNEALGKSTGAELREIHNAMAIHFERHGIRFLDYCYCPHHPRAVVPELGGMCRCRKPSPYWLYRAATRYGIDLWASWMVGDRATDSACGAAAGVRSIRVGNVTGRDRHAVWHAEDLAAAVRLVLQPGDGVISTSGRGCVSEVAGSREGLGMR
jgi:D-glycero-D-manno-heptose 1,7-bisphosphate phosphatase